MPRLNLRPALTALLLLSTLPAVAQAADEAPAAVTTAAPSARVDEDPQDQLLRAAATQPGSGWIFGGGLAVTNPGYVGYSREYTPFPLVFYHYGRFFLAGITAGYLLSNGDHYRFSLIATPEFN
ncbi:MAG TPA: hypothetical protein VGV16_07545, partial [Gammaproteobacteria bacterium]|nr:hypothetical protein [Gammaproteobacteria bacterium]